MPLAPLLHPPPHQAAAGEALRVRGSAEPLCVRACALVGGNTGRGSGEQWAVRGAWHLQHEPDEGPGAAHFRHYRRWGVCGGVPIPRWLRPRSFRLTTQDLPPPCFPWAVCCMQHLKARQSSHACTCAPPVCALRVCGLSTRHVPQRARRVWGSWLGARPRTAAPTQGVMHRAARCSSSSSSKSRGAGEASALTPGDRALPPATSCRVLLDHRVAWGWE